MFMLVVVMNVLVVVDVGRVVVLVAYLFYNKIYGCCFTLRLYQYQ